MASHALKRIFVTRRLRPNCLYIQDNPVGPGDPSRLLKSQPGCPQDCFKFDISEMAKYDIKSHNLNLECLAETCYLFSIHLHLILNLF
jgi:hypothetical protein